MFDGSWSQWNWVWFAWAQLALAYGGYALYLAWRARRKGKE